MSECQSCGAHVSPDEHFCGNCGARLPSSSGELKTVAAGAGDEGDLRPREARAWANTLDDESPAMEQAQAAPPAEVNEPSGSLETTFVAPETEEPSTSISSNSLGGSFTDNVAAAGKTSTPKEGTTGGHRPTVKQLASATVLNGRYEIVRRIGGGGMGAVYLAKDRNLGDAPRAVKEMVESHLDPGQDEKAIGNFKRESLLLTSLEHPSIPTIYDYFYDETLGRFYIVMKDISGGDLASRMRAAVGGRLDEKTVTDWGMQVADVLDYLHSRPKPIIYRDLKPANLMIDGNSGRIMLIDFGIARWVSQQEKGVTAVGTMGYAPP